jgi:EmrB/QacA subfamily drug resistance transporter
MLAMFLSSLNQTLVATAMPRIVTDLGGFTHYTWITTAYIITSAVTLPITGKLIDMYGRKYFCIAGLIIFALTSFMCGLSTTMAQLIIWRGIQGMGGGILMANSLTIVGDLFPPAERGKYQGLMAGVLGVSSIIGPILGGFLTDTISWHWVFYINVPLAVLITFLFVFFFPNYRPDNLRHAIDYYGLVTLILAVVPTMLALSWGGVDYPWISAQILGMFAFSALMLVIFILIESKSKEPIIPLSLFRSPVVSISVVVIFFTAIGMFGTIIFVPLFFQGVLGLSATTSGSFLTPMMLGMVAGSITSGQVLSRTGGHYRLQGIVGIAVMALGMGLLSRMTIATSYSTAVVNIVLTGFGLGITMPLYTIAVQNAVSHTLLGVATSATAFFRSLGASVGLAIFGSVMNNRFAAEFMKDLPPVIQEIVPQEQLDSLVRNPQALVNMEVQGQMGDIFEQLGPQASLLLDQVIQSLRNALEVALSSVFFIGLITLLLAFVINLFLKELPLRKHHIMDDAPLG